MDFANVKSWRVVDPQRKYRTGDILLFSGSGLSSTIIKTFTHSLWSYIGMVCWIELEYLKGEKKIELFSFELGSKDHIDLMSDEIANLKVRLVRLSSIVKMYDMVAIRPLRLPERSPKESRRWARKFQSFALEHKGTPFFDVTTTLSTHFLEPGAPKNQTTCAQIAGNMLRYLKVYSHPFDTSQLNPEDFSSSKETFPGGIFASKEIVIYRDKKKVYSRIFKISIVVILLVLIIIILLFWRKHSKDAAKQ